jgi:polyisoprenoid-binding protein YceI
MRIVVAFFCSIATLAASADPWRMSDDSSFTFETEFEGTPLPGNFGEFAVLLEFDPQHPADGHLRVTVDLTGIDMGDPDMNDAIAAPEWFDFVGFPQAIYDSTDISQTPSGSFVARGELNLKGVRRNVEVPVIWSDAEDTASMRGAFTVRRGDFSIGSGEWAIGEQIGNEVDLQFSLELERIE